MSLLKGLGVVQFNVTDWKGARKFYGETLGLPVAFDTGEEVGWCEFGEAGKTTLAINLWRASDGPKPGGAGGATPVFNVDDCAKAVAELRKRGVKADDPVTIPGMVSYANVYDPEGNRFQVAQSMAPSS
jgi:predicted enzyme related to lactoylglutathione lyase